jgi:hypothetical protein
LTPCGFAIKSTKLTFLEDPILSFLVAGGLSSFMAASGMCIAAAMDKSSLPPMRDSGETNEKAPARETRGIEGHSEKPVGKY